MVMDKFCAYKTEKVRELVEGAGCELLYLSPYSHEHLLGGRELHPL
jgi:hypothetical protein